MFASYYYNRMKTANDLMKHLEEFRSDMSDDNTTVLRIGLVMYLCNNTNSDTAIKVASYQAGAFINIPAK